MLETWIPILLGWPMVLIAVSFLVGGIVRASARWVWIATVFALPMSLYLAATPLFGVTALFLPILLVLSGLAVRKGKVRLAWAFALPYLAVITWLVLITFFLVDGQNI